jgi:hypothetical protein
VGNGKTPFVDLQISDTVVVLLLLLLLGNAAGEALPVVLRLLKL